MSENSVPEGTTTASLELLNGQPPTAELVRRWRRYLELPAAAHAQFWEIMNPILLGLPEQTVPQHVAQAAQRLNIESTDLALALEGCHVLLTKATAANLDTAGFDRDLRALSGEQGEQHLARATLIEGYERAQRLIRQRFVAASVAEHGKVVTGLNWRIDRILASSHGTGLNTTILLMTLHYQDAGKDHTMTFQLSDATLRQIRDFCDQMLKLGAEATSEQEIQAAEAASSTRAGGS